MHPHVDHHDVGKGQAKERTFTLKGLLILFLPPIRALNIEYKCSLVLSLATPDSLNMVGLFVRSLWPRKCLCASHACCNSRHL